MSQNIPGVPMGAKIVRVAVGGDNVKEGEPIITTLGKIEPANRFTKSGVVVAPSNPYGKFLHEVEADIKAAGEVIDHYEPEGLTQGDRYWALDGTVGVYEHGTYGGGPRFILKPRKRRVLVVECEIDDGGWARHPGGSHMRALGMVDEYPNIYRIEERDL